MIVFGSNSSHLKFEHLNEAVCPHCQSQDVIDINVFGRYAHIFWIPVFPMGKTGTTSCQHCKQTLKEKEMPSEFKQAFKHFKGSLKTPVWHFSGLIIIALFVGWSIYAGKQNQVKNDSSIANPMVGDVYEVKTNDEYYSLLKVTRVGEEQISIVSNKFEVSRTSKLQLIDKEDNFQGETFEMDKDRVLELYQTGDIIDVKR